MEGWGNNDESVTKDRHTCSVCHNEGEVTPASQWCSECKAGFCDNCVRYHRRMPLSRYHKTHSLGRERSLGQFIKCTKHHGMILSHFCENCLTVLCGYCISSAHSKCKNITPMNGSLQGSITSSPSSTSESSFSRSASIRVKTSVKEEVKTLGHQLLEACRQAREAVSRKEKELIKETCLLCNQQSDFIDDDLEEQESHVDDLEQKLKHIDMVLASGTEKDLFEAFSEYSCINADEDEDSKFKPVMPVLQGCKDDVIHAMNKVELRVASGDEAQPILEYSINMKDTNDRIPPSLVDVTVVDVEGIQNIVVTDSANKNIKVSKLETESPVMVLQLDDAPFGVTKHDAKYVLITVPSLKRIDVVSLDPKLLKSSEIFTRKKYCGICELDSSHIIVSTEIRKSFFRNMSSIDVLDMCGTVLKSIRCRTMPNPVYLSALSFNNVLVTDRKNLTLSSITTRGEINFTYKSSDPLGVSSCNGDILLVDGVKNCVIRLDKNGRFLNRLLTSRDGLRKPNGIFVYDDRLVFITSSQFVRVFSI